MGRVAAQERRESLTGAKERKENLEGLDKSLQHVGKDIKHAFDSLIQCVGHALVVVVSCFTLGIDVVKAIGHGLAWAGSGVVGTTKDLMHEHSTMTHETG